MESPRVFSWIPGKREGEERDRGEIGKGEGKGEDRQKRREVTLASLPPSFKHFIGFGRQRGGGEKRNSGEPKERSAPIPLSPVSKLPEESGSCPQCHMQGL